MGIQVATSTDKLYQSFLQQTEIQLWVCFILNVAMKPYRVLSFFIFISIFYMSYTITLPSSFKEPVSIITYTFNTATTLTSSFTANPSCIVTYTINPMATSTVYSSSYTSTATNAVKSPVKAASISREKAILKAKEKYIKMIETDIDSAVDEGEFKVLLDSEDWHYKKIHQSQTVMMLIEQHFRKEGYGVSKAMDGLIISWDQPCN
jgi:hypothetical protein